MLVQSARYAVGACWDEQISADGLCVRGLDGLKDSLHLEFDGIEISASGSVCLYSLDALLFGLGGEGLVVLDDAG